MASLLICVAALPLLFVTGYLLLLTLLSGHPGVPMAPTHPWRFVIVVPAHDEEAGICRTVQSLLALDWPVAQRRVCVVADNCSDATAERASAAGAQVMERHSETEKGKGYALAHAFEALLGEDSWDAAVVIDADSTVAPNLLAAFAARLQAGEQAVQAFYGVLNPGDSWRTRLMTIALAIFHRLRGRGREALGVSCGLRGNGMCFSAKALRTVPHRAYSIVEDVEYGIQLGLAGIRVAYADETEVRGEMVLTAKSATSQRQRWESGRGYAARTYGPALLRDAMTRRSGLLFDLFLDVVVPPLGTVAVASALLLLVGVVLCMSGWIAPGFAVLAAVPAMIVAAHVMRGVALSGLGAQGWATLAFAPLYLAWKLSLRLRRAPGVKNWIRTDRGPAESAPTPGGDGGKPS